MWLFSFRLERTLVFSEGGFEGFKGPFVLALEGFEAFEGFEGGFEAFVLTFEAFKGFLPFDAPPPAPRPLRCLDLRRLRRLAQKVHLTVRPPNSLHCKREMVVTQRKGSNSFSTLHSETSKFPKFFCKNIQSMSFIKRSSSFPPETCRAEKQNVQFLRRT